MYILGWEVGVGRNLPPVTNLYTDVSSTSTDMNNTSIVITTLIDAVYTVVNTILSHLTDLHLITATFSTLMANIYLIQTYIYDVLVLMATRV